MARTLAAAVLTLTLAAAPAAAQRFNVGSYGMKPLAGPKGPDAPAGVDYEQKLGGKLPLDLTFYDHLARPVTLGEAAGGKPLVLVMMYSRCPRLCSEVLTKLLESLKTVRRADPTFVAGEQFNMAVVSVDPKDSPDGMVRPRRHLFLKEYDGRPEDAPGVAFLTASRGQGTDHAEADARIHELADAVGFRYTLLARGKNYQYDPVERRWLSDTGPLTGYPKDYDFQHPPGVVFVAPDGTITRYLLGLDYKSTTVRQAVVEASGGRVGGLSDKVAFYCFAYDDVKGHYRPTMRVLALAAAPFGLLVLGLAGYTIRTARREGRPTAGTAGADPLTPTGGC
jgi:protein SCO1/2